MKGALLIDLRFKSVRLALLLLIAAFSYFLPNGLVAQTAETEKFSSACGPKDAKVEINVTDERTEAQSVPPGKSLLVFIEDFRADRPGHRCFKCGDVTMTFALEGRWVGGTKGFSHSSVLVDSGTHHLCVRTRKGNNDMPAMLSLQAESGNTYYLIAVPQYEFDYYVERFSLADPDEGKFLTQISKTAKIQ